MRISRFQRSHGRHVRHNCKWRMWPPILLVLLGLCADIVTAQDVNPDSLSQQIQKLTDAVASTQAQLEQSQRQISELQKQLKALQLQMTQSRSVEVIPESSVSTSSPTNQREPADTTSALQDIHDRQVMQESQIATQEQTKVESESKYPVKVTGLLLLNGFVNTQAVDMPATPTLALGGSGSTGFSVRQTVL